MTTGPSCSSNISCNSDAGSFECNICFDLAQDPIVTLCGHLYCWPCLYKWLRIHARSHECPVCKAVIDENKVVPLYGRGKIPTDPRSKVVAGIEIPSRPAGQRPETARQADPSQYLPYWLGMMGGFPPMAVARFGNFVLSAGVGGLFPSFFNVYMHDFPSVASYGAVGGFPYGSSSAFHSEGMHAEPQHSVLGQQADSHLATLFLVVGMLAVFALTYL